MGDPGPFFRETLEILKSCRRRWKKSDWKKSEAEERLGALGNIGRNVEIDRNGRRIHHKYDKGPRELQVNLATSAL
jgi:hypothetical protein